MMLWRPIRKKTSPMSQEQAKTITCQVTKSRDTRPLSVNILISLPTISGGTKDIKIKRNVGSGALQSVNVIAYNATGSQVVNYATTMTELTEVTAKITFSSAPSEVTVAAVAATSDGQGRVCSESTVRVTCT